MKSSQLAGMIVPGILLVIVLIVAFTENYVESRTKSDVESSISDDCAKNREVVIGNMKYVCYPTEIIKQDG